MPLRHHIPDPVGHVQDNEFGRWEFFDTLFGDKVEWQLPPIQLPFMNHPLQLTKFMVLELIVAVLLLAIFIPIARRRNGTLPKGPWWNAFESLLTFVRNEIARPNIGEHEADKYVPFLWTLFTFILFCNLLGMIPFLGVAHGEHLGDGRPGHLRLRDDARGGHRQGGTGAVRQGPLAAHRDRAQPVAGPGAGHDHGHDGHGTPAAPEAPPHERPRPGVGQIVLWLLGSLFGLVLQVMIFSIELFGTVIKSGVLAVRLFANMFAGHMVLAMILLFIVVVGNAAGGFTGLWAGVSFASVLGVVALSLLEIFVAFLQAYIFTFLTALFMGMSLHPEH